MDIQEIVQELTQDTLTPSPEQEPTEEDVAKITALLQAGMSPIQIFTDCFLPLEWALEVEKTLTPTE